ncbi:MAG: bifunctional nicotinamidase/pyrazinamidase [Tatlockia sp.]|nr:bifunctional nicotinamidase/pyrazinamidase [Tatlockia sp.]
MKTLIIVDAQNDFMPGGALAVPQGDLIIPVINALQNKFDLVVATQDWHPSNHKSFATNHVGKTPFEKVSINGFPQTLWPSHCVQQTKGAEFHPELKTNLIEAIFRKGMNPEIDSYSGFYDNQRHKSTGLAGFLREKKSDELYFAGLCTDICVYYTIQDAIKESFKCTLIEDACRPLDKQNFEKIRIELLQQGVKILHSTEMIYP